MITIHETTDGNALLSVNGWAVGPVFEAGERFERLPLHEISGRALNDAPGAEHGRVVAVRARDRAAAFVRWLSARWHESIPFGEFDRAAWAGEYGYWLAQEAEQYKREASTTT